jgi:glycosyltransferase involved in cell wall biosynthesis
VSAAAREPEGAGRERPLSVLQIVSSSARVGVTGVVSLLSRGLAARGIEVRVLCPAEGPLVEDMAGHGIVADVLAIPHRFDPGAILRMRRYLARGRFDIVHTHGQRPMFAGNIAARLARVPIVVTTFHELSSAKAETSRIYRLYAAVEGFVARHFTHACIATSNSVLEDAARVRGVERSKLTEIHNAVDREKFFPVEDAGRVRRFREGLGLRPDDRVIGALGSLIPVKGHEHLVAALPRVRASVPAARLVIAGSGPLREHLLGVAERCGVAADVLMPGDVAEANLLYNSLDVFALPSVSESCPLVVLEAIACRVPVVATSGGGVPELVDAGRTGLLVAPGDREALAAAIVRVLGDRALRDRLVAAAAERAETEYAPDRFADQHVALYRRLRGAGAGGAAGARPGA